MEQNVLYVGLDVSNETIQAAFLDGEARTVRRGCRYANDPEGWRALRTAIVSATALVGPKARVVCGMESTSNMHKRLEQALREEKRRPIEVHVLNPKAVKHFAKALLKDAKTDRIDSHTIALFLLRMKPEAKEPQPQEFEELKEATRTRRRLIEERTDHKNRLHKLLRYHFPGYRKVLGTRSFSKRLLVALAQCGSPHLLAQQSLEDLSQIPFGSRHRLGQGFAKKLHKLAAQAPRQELPKLSRLLIETTARRILELDALIHEMDQAIEEWLPRVAPSQLLTTIPGIAAVSAAGILAEVGDVRRFKTKADFVGYCGLYPIVWESGEAKRRYRMTSKGNRMLKMTLLVASAAARQYNPLIAAFYERLRRRGKSKKAAGGAIARKLAELVYTLLVRGEAWSAEKAMEGMQRAEAMAAQAC
ncbi:IS110 family transposase [Desulfosoma sp.]